MYVCIYAYMYVCIYMYYFINSPLTIHSLLTISSYYTYTQPSLIWQTSANPTPHELTRLQTPIMYLSRDLHTIQN